MALQAALLAPAAAAGVGLVRLTSSPTHGSVVLPVLLAVVAGVVVPAGVCRAAGRVLGLAAGVVGVALVSVWSVLPSATTWGLPTAHTAHVVALVSTAAWRLTRHTPTPVPASSGVVLWITAGAGLTACMSAAVLGGALAGRRRRLSVIVALVPSAGLFCYAALLSSGADRPVSTAAYLAGALVFVVVADAVWWGPAGSARRRWRPTALVGLLTVSLGAAVPLALGPGLSGLRLSAFAEAPPPVAGSADGDVARQANSIGQGFLVDDLGAVLRNASDAVLFVARSPVPTYWQVASLTTFDGSNWVADSATKAEVQGFAAIGGEQPVLVEPAVTATFSASIEIAQLQTTLLPVPPGTVSANGDGAVDQPGVGVFLPSGSPPGTEVTVVVASPEPIPASEATVPENDPATAPYLALPPLPSEVPALARRIVGGLANPLEKALALTGFFQGHGFRFSLSADYTGPQPLEAFLFHTRSGFCQQFAGAFAVLARAVGLPTRLAVGFTTGTPGPAPGSFVVTGADAHVWPQVYLGPLLGWVSFEPTPSSGQASRPSGVLAAVVPQPTNASSTPASASARAAAANRHAPTGPSAGSSTVRSSGRRGVGGGAGSAPSALGSALWWALACGAVVGVAVLPIRRRLARLVVRVRLRTLPNRAAVVAHWRQAEGALARRRMPRRPSETPLEHARRVAPGLDGAAASYRQLSELACLAEYSWHAVPDSAVDSARALERAVVRRLRERPPVKVP